jgi:hypothetical protein
MIRQSPSPGAGNVASVTGGGGGAGSGAGVAGPDDVDERVLKDVPGWLRVLRLHVSGVSVRRCLAEVFAYSSSPLRNTRPTLKSIDGKKL